MCVYQMRVCLALWSRDIDLVQFCVYVICVISTEIYLSQWIGRKPIYEAHPVSKFPWGRLQKQNTISWKYLLQ
jgi:hypothetical protein